MIIWLSSLEYMLIICWFSNDHLMIISYVFICSHAYDFSWYSCQVLIDWLAHIVLTAILWQETLCIMGVCFTTWARALINKTTCESRSKYRMKGLSNATKINQIKFRESTWRTPNFPLSFHGTGRPVNLRLIKCN